jgi:hypothetical protein
MSSVVRRSFAVEVGEAQQSSYVASVVRIPNVPHATMFGPTYNAREAVKLACGSFNRHSRASLLRMLDDASDPTSCLIELHLNAGFKFPEKPLLDYIVTGSSSDALAAM